MNYTWRIDTVGTRNQVNHEGATLTDAIVEIRWVKVGTDDDGNVGEYVSTTHVDATTTPAADFIAYSDLTKSNLVSWIESSIPADEMNTINQAIARKIEKSQTTTRVFNQ